MRCYEKNHRSQVQRTVIEGPSHWGGGSQPATAIGIESHDQVTILGITYGTTTAKSVEDSWAGVLRSVRARGEKPMLVPSALHNGYNMYTYAFSRKFSIWHKFSHPPRSNCNNLQLCAHGSYGKVLYFGYLCPPYNLLTRPLRTPLIYTASQPGYPISVTMPWTWPTRYHTKVKNRLYGLLLTLATTGNGTNKLRIARKYPGIAWQRVWTNVHTTGLSDPIK